MPIRQARRKFLRALFYCLTDLDNHEMRRNGQRTACDRCDGQCRSIVRRVADGQCGVDGGRFNDRHSDYLRRSRGAADGGIRELLTVQGQYELPGLGNTDLEKHQVYANRPKIEGRCAKTAYIGVCDWAVLREAHVCTGRDGRRIIRRHQSVKIGIAQHTAWYSLRPLRSDLTCRSLGAYGTLRALRTCCTLRACGSLGACFTCGALWAGRTLRTNRTGSTNWTLRADRTDLTDWALRADGTLRTRRSCFTAQTGRPLRTDLSGRTLWAGYSLRPLWAYGSDLAYGALRADGPLWTCRPCFTDGTLRACRANLTCRALRANRALRPYGTNFTLRPCGPLRSRISDRPLWANRSLRACRSGYTRASDRPLRACRSGLTSRTYRSSRPCRPLLSPWPYRPTRPLGTHRSLGPGRTHNARVFIPAIITARASVVVTIVMAAVMAIVMTTITEISHIRILSVHKYSSYFSVAPLQYMLFFIEKTQSNSSKREKKSFFVLLLTLYRARIN